MLRSSIIKITLEITYPKFHYNLPETNELNDFKALYWQQPINMSTLVNFIRMFSGYFIEIRTYPEPANKPQTLH